MSPIQLVFMKVLLVNPPYQRTIEAIAQTTVGPPMGLAYLAGAVRHFGHEVEILDANALDLTPLATVERSLAAGAQVIGLTAATPTMHLCGEIGSGIRAGGFDGKLLIGGPHPTALPEATLLDWPAFDLAALGEAEETLVELLDAFAADQPLSGIAGLCIRDGDNLVRTAIRTTPLDLDALAPPARDLLPWQAYVSPDGRSAATVIASRGCPAPCTYCAVPAHFGSRLRRRDPKHIAAEVLELADRLGVAWVNFIDDTFTWNRRWVLDLCSELVALDLHKRVRWLCLTRVDRVDAQMLSTMRRAGCRRIEMGIECASPEGIAALGKGIDEAQVVEAFQIARDEGLETLAFAMVNVPGETLADIDRTGDLLERVDPDYLQLTFCTPYPGTRLYHEALAAGRLRTHDFREFRFLRRAVLDNGVLTESQVFGAHRRLQRRFWLRPKVVGRMLKRMAAQPGGRLATARMALKALSHL